MLSAQGLKPCRAAAGTPSGASASRVRRNSGVPRMSSSCRPGGSSMAWFSFAAPSGPSISRSEEHTSELQSLMRISYAVFCLKKKKNKIHTNYNKQKIQLYHEQQHECHQPAEHTTKNQNNNNNTHT